MIAPDTRFRIARVPLARIVVTEHQPRYPDRALHYHQLLSDPQYSNASERYATGIVHLAPYGHVAPPHDSDIYTLLDGHHRYVGHILAGRADILALIEVLPGQPGYDDAIEAERLGA
jgi:hypothetical protein